MDPRCPHKEPFILGGQAFSAEEIIARLTPFVQARRIARIEEVVADRTYSIVPVTEGLYDRGNVSAVIRSAEALGFQALHNIDTSEKFRKADRVTQGAEKWLDIEIWHDTAECIRHLKALGYRILATHFDDAIPLSAIDATQPAAIVYGNEAEGVSNTLLELADERVFVPMLGFTQSFNISVAAALSLYHFQQERIRRLGSNGDLDAETRRLLKASFLLRSITAADEILLRA
jgi:tRNA (guanosine-2'-O-)-methyltransferase